MASESTYRLINSLNADVLILRIEIGHRDNRIAEIAAEAYQVIGALASDHVATPEITRALDYFSAIANRQEPVGEILPFYDDWNGENDQNYPELTTPQEG